MKTMDEIMLIKILMSLYIFLLGTVIASFLCAFAYRMEKMDNWREILITRSKCDHCGKILKWYELVPVLGWIFLRGKCAKCSKKISPVYPLFELFLGFNFLLFFLNGLMWPLFIASSMMFFLAVYDMEKMEVPQAVFIVCFAVALPIFVYTQINSGILLIQPLVEALAVAVMIVLINAIKKSFGIADILAILLLGFFVNEWQILKLVYSAIVIGAIVGVFYVLLTKKSTKTYIPFLPFIYAGFVFTVGFLL